MLTFSDPQSFNQLKPGLCLLPKPFHEYAYTLSLKLPQFCCLGRHCFGKRSLCSPYLLQELNPSFSLSLTRLCLSARYPLRGEPSFWVTCDPENLGQQKGGTCLSRQMVDGGPCPRTWRSLMKCDSYMAWPGFNLTF